MAETQVARAVSEVLDEGARALAEAGVPEPHRTARSLWSALAGVGAGEVWLARPHPAPPALATRFLGAVHRHARGEPLAYAAGSAAFRSVDLMVDERVLIPRPETEGLVDCVLGWAAQRFEPTGAPWGWLADVGTGSGAIAVSLSVEGRFEQIVATDVSAAALAVAEVNKRRLCPNAPLAFRHGPDCEPLEFERFAVIVSNPPYVAAHEFMCLDPSVRDHEPRRALVGGRSGLVHSERLLAGAKSRLRPGGLLAMEVDSQRAGETESLAHHLGWSEVSVRADLFGRPRYLLAVEESS